MTPLTWWVAAAGVLLLAAFWPRQGLVARARRRAAARACKQGDNALKHLLQESQAGRAASLASLKGTLQVGDRGLLRAIDRLRRDGLAASEGGRLSLTERGEQRARHLVRAHRLLERYLADEARLPVTSVHRAAGRLEHRLSGADADRLSASMGHPERDPHGDPIPSAGEGLDDPGVPITHWQVGEQGRIVHLEDEPSAVFTALVRLGLQPGQAFRVLRAEAGSLGLLVEDREVTLPLALAGNVFAAPLEEWAGDTGDLTRLSHLPIGQDAEVVSLAPTCQGLTRRRLLDLGFTPGTRLRPVLQTFAGDPRAYRVRGTTVALRRDQSSVVIVRPLPAAGAVQDERYQA